MTKSCEHLIAYADEGVHESLSSLARPLRLDARILHYLLEMETMDEHLTAFTTAVTPRASLDTLLLPDRKVLDICLRVDIEL